MVFAYDKRLRRNVKTWASLLVISSAAFISYKLYKRYLYDDGSEEENVGERQTNLRLSKRYSKKSIAISLSNSIVNAEIPLGEILAASEDVIFIVPPNMTLDDIISHVGAKDSKAAYDLRKLFLNNYKLLNCTNIEGFFNILKHLRPETLLVCYEDLGISRVQGVPKDLGRFVKEIKDVDNNKEHIQSEISNIFVQ